MTSAALTVNKEWNTKLISTENGEVAEEIVEEFHNLWNSEYALPYDDFYDIYKERYNIIQGYVPMNLQYLANSFKVNRLNLQILRKSIEEHLDLKSIFITYHKEESQNEKKYVDGKPDYADVCSQSRRLR